MVEIPIGRYVVDKIGDDQTEMGVTETPYRAHFEPTDVAKILIQRRLIPVPPPDFPDGRANLHKDADGNWVMTR